MQKIKNRFKQLMILIKCFIYKAYVIIKKVKNEDVWLISERGNEARDNGYTLYKYIKENHPEINVKYIITLDSPDIDKIMKEDIVEYRSKEHYILFLTAKNLISTHIMGFSPDFRLFTKIDKYNIIRVKGKKIFLQHGITKDCTPGLDKHNVNLDLFISGAKMEYEYFIECLHHGREVIKYTGFSRYDYLIDTSTKYNYVLVMPTWRTELFYSHKGNMFKDSLYCKMWNTILNSEELNDVLGKNELKLIFYPHIEMQKYLEFFNTEKENIIIADFSNYDVQELLCKSKILITDYSSVFFDFAYMEKPIIYFQFDYNEYRKSHYKEGYFSYEKNGFGDIVDNERDLIDNLKQVIQNGYKTNEKYLKRKKEFFDFYDTNNSERIFKEIVEIGV